MTVALKVRGDIDDLKRHADKVQRRLIDQAASRAINRILGPAKTATAKRLAALKAVPLKVIKKRLHVKKAKARNLSAYLLVLTARVLSGDIGKPKQDAFGAGAGSHYWASGFKAKMKSGHTAVFKRRRGARLPIEETGVNLSPQAERIADRQINVVGARKWNRLFNQQLANSLRRS